ncbi:MAG: sulfite exporter TauE/SafE family protein [Taibaiella sp.]|nr:sulfite exporter TauE/SafE family protein [Taibaiella sp.]
MSYTHLPEVFFHIGSFEITKHFFLLFIFAVLMIFSAIRMIRPGNSGSPSQSGFQAELLIVQGFGVGIITGLIGAGGGFLIVPALVLLLGMPMKEAIGTSLLIVAMNALLGFASSMNILPIPWDFLILFYLYLYWWYHHRDGDQPENRWIQA